MERLQTGVILNVHSDGSWRSNVPQADIEQFQKLFPGWTDTNCLPSHKLIQRAVATAFLANNGDVVVATVGHTGGLDLPAESEAVRTIVHAINPNISVITREDAFSTRSEAEIVRNLVESEPKNGEPDLRGKEIYVISNTQHVVRCANTMLRAFKDSIYSKAKPGYKGIERISNETGLGIHTVSANEILKYVGKKENDRLNQILDYTKKSVVKIKNRERMVNLPLEIMFNIYDLIDTKGLLMEMLTRDRGDSKSIFGMATILLNQLRSK